MLAGNIKWRYLWWKDGWHQCLLVCSTISLMPLKYYDLQTLYNHKRLVLFGLEMLSHLIGSIIVIYVVISPLDKHKVLTAIFSSTVMTFCTTHLHLTQLFRDKPYNKNNFIIFSVLLSLKSFKIVKNWIFL